MIPAGSSESVLLHFKAPGQTLTEELSPFFGGVEAGVFFLGGVLLDA